MPCSCPLVHRDFRKYPNRGQRPQKKDRYITPAARNATCLIRYGPRSLVCPALTASPIVLAYGLTECWSSGLTAGSFPSLHRPTGKSFWKGGVREGRTFFQKGFPHRKRFFLQICRRLPAVSKTKKSPAERGQKKTPSRCELQGGLEQSLAAAYFPT